jgi:nitrogen fixation NifU-like protein
MMDLYQEIVIDHAKSPRNKGKLDSPTHHAHGHNPLCGDELEVTLVVRDGIIEDVKCAASGCAISIASASIMSEEVKGKPVDEVLEMFRQFRDAMVANGSADDLGMLQALVPVREYPMRVKCATMAWHALKEALGA